MRNNHVRERLRSGGSTLGCFLSLGSAAAAEMLGFAGFDWLVFEMEHTPLDVAGVERLLQATAASDAIPLVRLPKADPDLIQRVLDIGAMGVVVPMIRTAAEAELVVRATRYPPAGCRSFGPLRAARYGLDQDDYFRQANDRMLVVLIIETAEAVENLPAIAAAPGVDVLFLGPFDLCLSLGLDPLSQPHDRIEAILKQTVEAASRHNVAVGLNSSQADQLAVRRAQGVRFLGYGPDHALLLSAARTGIAKMKDAASGE